MSDEKQSSLPIYHKPLTTNKGDQMTEILLALFAGAIVGILFSLIKLPLPAPPVLSGIAGIFGIYLGGMAYSWIIERFFS
jgi:XapX domain-containing protein